MENLGTPNQEKINQQFSQQFGQSPQKQLPNATAVLVLGIVSIVGCICYGIVGLICAIIALILAGKATALHNANPTMYSDESVKNMKAGKVCAIVGLCLSVLCFLFFVVYFILIGAAISSMPWNLHY